MSILLVILTLFGTLELFLVTTGFILSHFFPKKQRKLSAKGRLAVVIPAHNEEAHIAKTIESLQTSRNEELPVSIVVVADNCDDKTPQKATEAGARVLIRTDTTNRGKGQALEYAFGELMGEDFDAFLVIDADTVVEKRLLKEVFTAFSSGSKALQVQYLFTPPDRSLKSSLLTLATHAFNSLRCRGRSFFGFSAGILGNGFGMKREVLESIPYTAHSVVEDLEYHHHLVEKGFRVDYVDTTCVTSELPISRGGIESQRSRWEGGRFGLIKNKGISLLNQVFLKAKVSLFEPMLELFCLPLAYHTILVLLACFSTIPWVKAYAMISLSAIGLHLLSACFIGHFWTNIKALFVSPFYLVWKIVMLPKILIGASKKAAWVRTSRDK